MTRTDLTEHVPGTSLREIADAVGTPVFVHDGDELRATYARLRAGLHPRVDLFYSLKANPNVSVCSVLRAQGAGAEVSSLTELRTALRAGTDPDDVIFLGPGKSDAEIEAALDAGIHALVCESFQELALVDRVAARRGIRARVMLRVNPGFSVKGSGLTMGGKPRQFGIDDEQLLDAAGTLRTDHPHVELTGVHVYMGTRILDPATVVENTERILALALVLAERLDVELRTVDVGGGLGVAYFEGENDLDVDALCAGLAPVVDRFVAARPGTRLIMELGRFLVARAGTYVTRVRYTKTSRGESFAVADGGTNHHMAAVGIGSFVRRNFPVELVGRESDETPEPWTVTGPLCTPNDTIANRASLPPLRPGDLVAVRRSGAYGASASPGIFLGHGFPAEVLVLDGEAHVVRRPDTADDLLAPQRLVELGPPTAPSTTSPLHATV